MSYPSSVKKLIECLKDLPGIGEKSAERLAFSMVNFDKNQLTDFSDAILEVRDKLTKCVICHNISDSEKCFICENKARNDETIVVIETAKDIILFEKIGMYHGKYHVLEGLISPSAGINPSDINIKSLIERIKKNNTKELIFALKSNIEGETTTQYIKRLLADTEIKISKIAQGVPIETKMEYIDVLTLEMALEERKEIS